MTPRCRIHTLRKAVQHGLCAECVDTLPPLALKLMGQRSATSRREIRRALALKATASQESLRHALMEGSYP